MDKFLVCYDINSKPVYLDSKVKLNLKYMGEGSGVVEGIVSYTALLPDEYAAFYIRFPNPDYDSSKEIDDNNEKTFALMFCPNAIELID